MTQAAQPVATCARDRSGDLRQRLGRVAVRPRHRPGGRAVQRHVPATSLGRCPDYFIFICTRPPANNKTTPVASCTVGPPSTDPTTFITTTCSKPVGPTNQAATPSPACTRRLDDRSPTFVTTTCVKVKDFHGYAAACVPDAGTTPPTIKVVCTNKPLTSAAVAAGSCVAGNGGPVVTTCPRAPAGPLPRRRGARRRRRGA